MQLPVIPPGPAWAVALGMVFTGLALLLKTSVPLIQAVRRNGKNGLSAVGRLEDLANLKAHMDGVAEEARDHRDKIMKNLDDTRHALVQPLTTAALSMALMEHTLIEIRDRLPRSVP